MLKKCLSTLFIGVSLILLVGCGSEMDNSKADEDNLNGENDSPVNTVPAENGGAYEPIVSPNNEIGFKLLNEIESDDNQNLFISPTSLFMALSMVYNGADGITKEEISNVLNIDGMDAEELSKANAAFMSNLASDTDEIELRIANSIWLNEDLHFQEDFIKQNEDYFQAMIEKINVHDSNSADKINNWVKDATNDKIDEIVKPPLNPDLVSILINAIYFKGNWKYEFDQSLTEERDFHLADGSTKLTPFMEMREEEFYYMENEDFQSVVLPYGKEEHMSMQLFLPRETSSLEEFQQSLTADNWEKWNSELSKQEGTIILPKFQLEYEVQLNEALKALGMPSAFTKEANFSKMIEEDIAIWIDTVKQKTFIDVNEEGTEAAAVTSVEVVMESITDDMPFHMNVDRPFFFVIKDNETDAILFMGSISEPMQAEE